MTHFAAGAVHQERALIGANRSGKTLACSYETTCHLIGWYPDWWIGRRFDRPITAWVAGEDAKAVRESLQVTYLGPLSTIGTGLIPAQFIEAKTARGGVSEAVDTVAVRHGSGGMSRLVFKSYDQGRESFQAAKIDIMQYDEEPPLPIYSEGLTRTLSTNPNEKSGLVIAGFTPLRGLSSVVMMFLPNGKQVEGEIPRTP
jgi:phage terminase large subunit-like protein